MSDFIPIGLNKNKRTFKPKLGKNKRDRERDISNDDGTFQKSASEKSDEIQTNIESTKNQKLHVPKKRQIMLRDIPFLQKDKGKPKAVYDKKEESSEVSTRSIPIKDKGKQRAVYKDAIQEETEESIDSSGPTSPVEWIREVIETQHSDDPHELEIVYPDTLREIEHDLNVPPPKEFNDDKLETSIDRKRKLLEIAASTAGVQSSRKGKMWTDLETQVFYDGLSEYGTNFLDIADTIPGKSRDVVKRKYIKEERMYPGKVTKYLTSKSRLQ